MRKYGLFEESLRYHEDVELSERLSSYGFKLKYVPEAKGLHHHYLQAQDVLNIARCDGKALAMWYKNSPHIGTKLNIFGFYPTCNSGAKLKFKLADIIFNRLTIPLFLKLAELLKSKYELVSLGIYRRLYQAVKRKAIDDELRK